MKRHFRTLGALMAALLLLAGLTTPVFAEVTSLPDDTSRRILNIYKYSPSANPGTNGDGTENAAAGTGRVPLQDVEFELYKVPAGQTTSETPSTAEIAAITSGGPLDTIKTNAAGLAVKDFGIGSTNDGTYLIVEKDNPAVTEQVDPFYVSIPLTDPEEDAWLYTVNVYPKNDVPAPPPVDKDVNEVGNDSDTHDIGEIQTWILRGGVPEDLYRTVTGTPSEVYAKNYTFTDELDDALTYKGNIKVTLFDKAGNEDTVLDPAHYNTAGTSNVDTAGGTVKVALTEAGMKYVAQNLGSGTEIPELRVSFDTIINDTAVLGTNIENTVELAYTNSANNEYEPEEVESEEIPEVHTGGLLIDKYNQSGGAKLAGATFKIARDATAEEIADNGVTKETIKVAGVNKTVVFVEFYDSDAIAGVKVSSVTTTAAGKAVINGLAYGNYYLVETKAPEGYNLLSGPVQVTVNAISHTTAIEVANSAKFELPVTGGAGVMMFTMAGILLIGAAVILIVFSKKKKVTAE